VVRRAVTGGNLEPSTHDGIVVIFRKICLLERYAHRSATTPPGMALGVRRSSSNSACTRLKRRRCPIREAACNDCLYILYL
jgi:hypothetical protein